MQHEQQTQHNYLRTFRKRSGLTQDEVAFLLGGQAGTSVSRHENGNRVPTLEVALAYAILYEPHVDQLFLGVRDGLTTAIRGRSRRLLTNVKRCPPSPTRMKKLKALAEILERSGGNSTGP